MPARRIQKKILPQCANFALEDIYTTLGEDFKDIPPDHLYHNNIPKKKCFLHSINNY